MPRTKQLKTTTVIVRNEEGKFLGVTRKDNYNLWGFAGGKCEKNESGEDCAKRELLEETGLVAEEMKHIDDRMYVNNYNRPKTIDAVSCYEVTKYSGELLSEEELKERGEGLVRWVSMEPLIVGAFADYSTAILKQYYGLRSMYLVEEHSEYEGSQVLAAFSNEEDAIKYCDARAESCNKRYTGYYKKIASGSYSTGDGGLDVSEIILDLEFYEEG